MRQIEIYTYVFSIEKNLEVYLPKRNQWMSGAGGGRVECGEETQFLLYMKSTEFIFFSVIMYYLNKYK